MSRGVVLWPDEQASIAIGALWTTLADHGLPSLATHTHRLHQPHCSLSVAEELAVDDALDAVGRVPAAPIPLHVEAVAVFPPVNALVLAVVVNEQLLAEQRRVHMALRPLAVRPWPYFEYNAWVPHITLSVGNNAEQLARAIPLMLDALPIRGTFDRGGVEDGTTGENWPTSNAR